MSTTTQAPESQHAISPFTSHLHPIPSWDLADHAVPSGREETWRFTPVDRFKPLMTGEYSGPLDWRTQLPAGVTRRTLTTEETRQASFDAPIDMIAVSAVEAVGGGAELIEIPAEARPAEPVLIEVEGQNTQIAGQLIVQIGRHAEVTIVLRHSGVANFASKIEIQAGDGARVDIVSVQDWSEGAVHGGQFSVQIGRDAKVRTIQATVGVGDVRVVERAEYNGVGGDLEQLGIYFVQAGGHVEHRLLIDHNHPRTESHVDYRGALQGKGAHSVWIGDVLIRKTAVDIDTYESNKNLMLTEGCQADSVPNLEIETGEIRGAGHASSTGRFDDEQLFYLRSRGIPADQARRLVVEGFFMDIIRRIGVPEIEARLSAALDAQLATIDGITHTSLLDNLEDDK